MVVNLSQGGFNSSQAEKCIPKIKKHGRPIIFIYFWGVGKIKDWYIFTIQNFRNPKKI